MSGNCVGQYTDPTGLIYLRARYYDPATGQFLTVDPLVDTTRSSYGYTAGNPLNSTDPSGMCDLFSWGDNGCAAQLAADVPGGQTLDDSLTSFVGFGDTLTGGLSRDLRHGVGLGGAVNECSASYGVGTITGNYTNLAMALVSAPSAIRSIPQIVRSLPQLARSVPQLARSLRSLPGLLRGSSAAESALADASNAAFRAADNVGDWSVSAKHLPGTAGRWAKFAPGVDPQAAVQEALRSEGAAFLPNATGAADTFIVRADLGYVVGSNGQTALRIVVSNDGRIITAFPVK